MSEKINNYSDFWPFYLQEHADASGRLLHYIGTTIVIGIFAYAFATQSYVWLWGMPLAGYSFAWAAHFFIEKNKPATFTYPLWSLVSDFRMYFLWLAGRLGPHLRAAGVVA